MHSFISRARFAFVLAGALVFCAPATADAAAGLYLQLGLGYGAYTGTKLVTVENKAVAGDVPLDSTDPACCAGPGLATQLRLGFSILGFAGPEFGFVGDGWNSFGGGAGFVGGGVRIFPLKFLSLTGLDTKDLPIDMGIGIMFGYSLLGEDFAYDGTFWDLDFHIEYKLASFISAGIKLDTIFASYNNFGFTSYKNNRGRCLNGITMEEDIGIIDKSQADGTCENDGPSTTLISPQVIFTFHFDILDV